MPTYEFFCETCGPFERWRDHRLSGEPMPCPSCGAAARRVYSMPDFNVSSSTARKARLLDEQGPTPAVVERSRKGEPTPASQPRRVGGRPWQISH